MSTQARRFTQRSLHAGVILFIPLSADQSKPGKDLTATEVDDIPRRCPNCKADSIIGHGRRRKQAHDETHDWIDIRRGLCSRCNTTFTFLPWFSPPYGHYSWIARSRAMVGCFLEQGTLESAAPLVKDPDRLPVSSTLRRWFQQFNSPDLSRLLEPWCSNGLSVKPAEPLETIRHPTSFPFLRRTLDVVRRRIAADDPLVKERFILSQETLAYFLQILLPRRC